MAGKIIADTLEHSTAGSIATNYVVEGSAKAWVNISSITTTTIRNSLNTSSVTDRGTGEYTHSFSSSWSAVDYVIGTCGASSASAFSVLDDASVAPTTSATAIETRNSGYSLNDTTYAMFGYHGDLA